MEINVSIGEIMDKFSIISLKKEKIKDEVKLKNIEVEFNYLKQLIDKSLSVVLVNTKYTELYEVNAKLWEIEDNIRIKESKKEFDSEFIELARSVYFFNDKRAEIKKEINITYNSEIVEEKSYEKY